MAKMGVVGFTVPSVMFLAISASLVLLWRMNANSSKEDEPNNRRPNFIIFFADDVGWGDVGANWEPNRHVTPNLNKMAEQGIRFTDFHVASSVCAPSRAALLTGRIGLRTGMTSNFGPGSLGGLPRTETTLAQVLLASGYHTGMVGKWHLGIQPPYHPNSKGFEYYYGLPYSNDMGCLDVPTYNSPTCRLCPHNASDIEGPGQVCRNYDTAIPLYENREIVEQPVDHIQLGDHYAEKATEFIGAAVESDKPFFLYVAFAHTHLPLAFAPRFANSTDVKTVYADTLYEMDDIIGRIMNSLKEHGVDKNTMAFFSSDNGPWQGKCPYSGSAGPFTGEWLTKTFGGGSTGKGTTWEGGQRTPAIAIWPDRIPPNRTSDALTSAMDLFPTIVAAAGAEMPPWRKYDGINLLDVMEGKTDVAHEVLYHPNSGVTGRLGQIDTIRIGPYKVYWRTGGNGGTARPCKNRPAREVVHDPPIVFNVDKDPAESTPVNAESDLNYAKILLSADLLRASFLEDVKSDNRSRRLGGSSKDVMPCCDPTQHMCRCSKQVKFSSEFPAVLESNPIKKSIFN